MEANKNEKKKSPVNITAVILAFLIGLTIGNIDTDKLRSAAKADTTNQSLISREQAETKQPEKMKETTGTTAKFQSESDTIVKTDSFTVYITPTGKRYHLNPDCAGENKIKSDLEEAKGRGLTACKRCANG